MAISMVKSVQLSTIFGALKLALTELLMFEKRLKSLNRMFYTIAGNSLMRNHLNMLT